MTLNKINKNMINGLPEDLSSLTQQLAQNVEYKNKQSANAKEPLAIPCYYGNQTCHPKVIWDNDAKYGSKFVMAHTPYPLGSDIYENPSIVVSADGKTNWKAPTGLTNPVFKPDDSTISYYSDVDLCDDGTKLIMIWRETDRTTRLSRLWYSTTTDLVNWTPKVVLYDYGVLSNGWVAPSLNFIDGKYRLYYRNSSSNNIESYMYIESSDFVTWSASVTCTFDYGKYAGHVGWHNEFRLKDGIWHCLAYAIDYANQGNSQFDGKLFMFTSTNGKDFSNIDLVMTKSEYGFGDNNMYKSSFIFWGTQLWVYYSAMSKDKRWNIGLATSRSGSISDLTGYNVSDYGVLDKITNLRAEERIVVEAALKILNIGIGGAEFGVISRNRVKLLDDTASKSAYLEVGGMYFDTLSNREIETSGIDNAFYQHPVKKNLVLRTNGQSSEIRRTIDLMLAVNAGVPTLTFYSGAGFVQDIVSTAFGLQINFVNLVANHDRPVYILKNRSAAGATDGTNFVKYDYLREQNGLKLHIGLKSEVNGVDMPLNTLTGMFHLTIFV